jgi:hypothetical protein
MNRLDKKQIFIGTILGIILSILTLILLTRNIQPLSAQQTQPQYMIFKTSREGFKFLKQNPIGGRQPAEYAPIFAQTPTTNSLGNQVATKEYVDKGYSYPYWILAEYQGTRYFIPTKRSPQLRTTDWMLIPSYTGYYATSVNQQGSAWPSGSYILGYSRAEFRADINSFPVLDSNKQFTFNKNVLKNILGKQIYKIEVKRFGNSSGACSFGIEGKIGVIWTAKTSYYRNPPNAEVSYNKKRDWYEDINLGSWWSRKNITMGEITSQNGEWDWWENTYNVEFLSKNGGTKYAFNDGGIDYLAYIKSFPAYNYLVVNANDRIFFDSLIVRRDGYGQLNCYVRFTYYDDYMPENVINPEKPQFIGGVPRLSCRSVGYYASYEIPECSEGELLLERYRDTPVCCKIVY